MTTGHVTCVITEKTFTDDSHISTGGRNLRLVLIHFRYQMSDGLLKIAVLGGVDERVDTAVGERHQDGELIEPAREVDRISDKAE